MTRVCASSAGGSAEQLSMQRIRHDCPVTPTPSVLVVEDCQSARAVLGSFRAYPKLMSWILLHAGAIPALPGVVVTEWDAQAAEVVGRFAGQWPSRCVLLRSDARSESGLSPRGGFLVEQPSAEQEARDLLDAGRVVFFLEPASPFDDLYSVNLAPDADWRHWWLEVVGPGFDASDLKRGDVTPNETVRVTVAPGQSWIDSREIANPAALHSAREIRFRKVARMLGCAPPEVEQTLRLRGETLLLDEPSYVPLPATMIDAALDAASRLRPVLTSFGLSDQRVMLSLSFLTSQARLVFWDVVWPDVKYLRGYPSAGKR
jgi:hypothetical protein